jgi:hypothetical protein
MGRKIRVLTQTQIDYIEKQVLDSIKYTKSGFNECYVSMDYVNRWTATVYNIESDRFYLHYLTPKYFILDTLDVKKGVINFQFGLTNKFFKEIL